MSTESTSKGYNLNELNHDDYVMLECEFHDELRERANNDYKDRINEYMCFVPELKNLSETEHNIIKETIKKIGDCIYKALDEVSENFPLWYDHYAEEEKNENGVAYQDDVELLMEVFFKNNYLDFVCKVFFIFEWLLRVYNDQRTYSPGGSDGSEPPPKEEEGAMHRERSSYKPDLDELLDDYVNIYLEKLCENYVKEHEIDNEY